ncbi:hypothetical protein DMUE_2624 [Dictyocoela muelleri]|nr:hypothetical protein DMUE_2624 [Dictyocoela muelleri]
MVETSKKICTDKYVWKCQTKSCAKYKTTKTIRSGCFLCDFNIILIDCIDLIYRFGNEEQSTNFIESMEINRKTIFKFYNKLRLLIYQYMIYNPIMLGGDGIICQIDETCFCHKQKHRIKRASGEQI